ncbi:hypothetical protein [Antarcticirhabdus aurantiaca]|uniref:Uncharacterized protein n=1 Tax=Antarcticirhabdus aurantiaca TaxID=2606717 RepID=A0ACD4NU75_9HYPH|nr:hypothetical protein [Antarcticirhabdus aurantiaca]WAJ30625.1 hypothetical protein OXU80_10635 [Jeongeuplla avenae]
MLDLADGEAQGLDVIHVERSAGVGEGITHVGDMIVRIFYNPQNYITSHSTGRIAT